MFSYGSVTIVTTLSVDFDWIRSRQLGILGVPTFVLGQHGISGAQSYEILERFVVENSL